MCSCSCSYLVGWRERNVGRNALSKSPREMMPSRRRSTSHSTNRLVAEDGCYFEDVRVRRNHGEVATHVLGDRSWWLLLVVRGSDRGQRIALTENSNEAVALDHGCTRETSLNQIVYCVENLSIVTQHEDGPLHDVLGQQHGSARVHGVLSYDAESSADSPGGDTRSSRRARSTALPKEFTHGSQLLPQHQRHELSATSRCRATKLA